MTAPPKLAHFEAGARFAGLLVMVAPAIAVAQGAPARITAVADATRFIDAGRAFKATLLLLPELAGNRPPDPALTLLAARAASQWSGWGTVVRLLAGETWLDRHAGGSGRALLARALVERGSDAVADARAALAAAPDSEAGARTVLLARAFDRAGYLDSAAAAYQLAARRLPGIADWLLLRAAGVTVDSAARSALYAGISLPAAAARVRWTEALARDRTGNPLGAARLYASLGAPLIALRLRLGAAPDSAARAAIRAELVGFLSAGPSADDTRAAIDLLDREFPPLTRREELVVARRAATADRAARAAQGFARAGPLADGDRLGYGSVLARLGRHQEAITRFSSVEGRELRTRAHYLRARSILASQTREAGIVALRQVFDEPTADSATAATAGFLRADLLTDKRDDGAARTAYLEVARRFPTTSHGSRAAFQAALILFLQDHPRDAAAEFTALVSRPGDRTESAAALYWSGRALRAAGDSAAARAAWRQVIERYPASYYALPAATALGTAPPLPGSNPPLPAPDSAALAAIDRGLLLDRLGMRVEARFEHDRLTRDAEATPSLAPGTAAAFAARGFTARAYRLAARVGEAAILRLQYPLPRDPAFLAEAGEAKVDPLLAAALIRQESGFDPQARSAADARGLMQVMPSLGGALARSEGVRDWDAALLYEPEVNIRFGMTHLAEALRRYDRLEHALAGYNAGTRPVDQWLALPGAKDDPEVFIERIQYVETRDYVRRVLRNLAVYRALYPGTA